MLSFKKSLSLLVLFVAFAGYFLSKLHISNTPSTYIPPNLESRILNDQILSEFNNEDSMVYLFQSKVALDKELLQKLSEFTSGVEALELTGKVRSIFSYEAIRAIDDGFEVTNIIDDEKIKNINFQKIKEEVLRDRFVKDFFITKDMKTFGVVIEPALISNSLTRKGFEEEVFAVLEKNGIKQFLAAYGGEFSVDTAQFKELDNIMTVVIPMTFLVGVSLLLFLFNSYFAVAIGMLFNGIVTSVVLSLFGLFGWPYNMIGSMIPTLMMALCIAFIVHLFNGILLRKEEGEDHQSAVRNAVKAVNRPSLYSALTTSAGLFSLSISDIPPVKSVGVIGGIGVLVIYIMVIYLMPPILLKYDLGTWKQNKIFKRGLDSIVEAFLKTSLNHSKKVIVGILGVLILLSFFILNVKSESNLYKFFDDDHDVNIASRLIKKHFVGTTIVNLVFDAQEKSVISAEFNQKIDELKTEVLKIDGVGRMFSATDILKQLNWAFQGENDNDFSVPKSDELIEQYFLIYDGDDLYDFLSRGQKRFKVSLNMNVEGANQIERVTNEVQEIIKRIGFDGVKFGMSGYGKMFSDQENLIMNDLFKSVAISLGIIFLLMAVLWRSGIDSLFCMIPNISPVFGMFIIMGIFGIWLDIGTAMIASITVGIAVDDTIHIFEGFKKRIASMSVRDALTKTYTESGRAIIITTIILSGQFIILTFTDFRPLRNFGLLTTVGIITALIFDLLLLPALIFLKFNKKA